MEAARGWKRSLNGARVPHPKAQSASEGVSPWQRICSPVPSLHPARPQVGLRERLSRYVPLGP